ncbi:RICIN domain-containing protein, partial [Phytohabitans kaempferiae]
MIQLRRTGRSRRSLALVAGATALVAAGAITTVGLTTASAATVSTSTDYVFVNRHSNKAMDLYNWATNDGAPIVQFARNDLAVQRWRFVDAGSGYYKIRSVHSGKVLEVPNATDGARLVQMADSGNTRQHFRLADSDAGYVRFINRHSNKALDVWEWSTADGGPIAQFTDLNGWNQQWQLVNVGGGGGNPTTPPPSGSWPTPTGQVNVNGTISVSGTLDGGMRRYCCIGDGGQEESQD